jgi:glycine cleavage system aminomethyltransferase T
MAAAVAMFRTPLHAWHQAHGARFAVIDGWELPAVYTSVPDERAAAEKLAIADLTPISRFTLIGKPHLLQPLIGDLPAPCQGRVFPLLGGRRGVACCLTEERWLLAGSGEWPAEFRNEARDETSALGSIGLFGPGVDEIMCALTSLDLGACLGPGRCAETGLASVHAVLARHPSRAEVHIHVGWDVAEYVWERIWDVGADRGIVAIGHEVLEAIWQGEA